MLKKILICLLPAFFLTSLYSLDTARVLFVYGSRPKVKQESKWFGGIHGGHVSVQYQSVYASFVPEGKFHYVASRKHIHSTFVTESEDRFVYDTQGSRYLIICIPVTVHQRRALDSVMAHRLAESPYDYAFIGMRCASAAYEVLSAAGIYPRMRTRRMIYQYFYPKKLRKKLLKDAIRNQWQVVYRPGRNTRKWERD
jgi:hypothetical protein